MGHIPYGYIIENGRAIVDSAAAKQVKALFDAYLSGSSLTDAAKQAGISRCHASIAKILTDLRYVKDDFYPPIINEDMFVKVGAERKCRAEVLGRTRKPKPQINIIQLKKFIMPVSERLYNDPFKQAEYAYSLIESEVLTDGE